MRKLLVIDDNLDFLGFLASALEKYFEVYTATGLSKEDSNQSCLG